MRHNKKKRTLGRKRNQRNALIASLANSLIIKEKISTTEAKAKELRPFIEKLVTKSRSSTIGTRRHIISVLGRPGTAKKMLDIIGPKFKDRNGGYTRITKIPRRMSDGSPMAIIEFV